MRLYRWMEILFEKITTFNPFDIQLEEHATSIA